MGEQPMSRLIGPVRPKFVLFGSSIVQLSFNELGGWGAILAGKYARKADIILRGYGGWNSRQALEVIDKIFPEGGDTLTQPALVIVYFGGNDSMAPIPPQSEWESRQVPLPLQDDANDWESPHVPLDEYVENMRKIATHIQGRSKKTRLIFLGTPPVNDYQIADAHPLFAQIRNNVLGRQYSEALIKLGKEMNFKVIDLFAVFQKKRGWWRTSFVEDGIHLTPEGNELVADAILEVLKEADWVPNLHYTALPTEFDGSRLRLALSESTILRLSEEPGKLRSAL